MKNYTKIPNEVLSENQLSVLARYLYCVLLKHCGKDNRCFPGQKLLASTVGVSDRQIRRYLSELINEGLITKRRRGWNRTNTYMLSKDLDIKRTGTSCQLGSTFPLHRGNTIPPKSTYLKGKGKRSIKGFEKFRKQLIERGLIKNRCNEPKKFVNI